MLPVALCLALLTPQNPGDVVINEFVYDDTSTDDREFVELYNNTNAPIDISNWVIESRDQFVTPNTDYTIPPGNTIPANGFFVVGAGTVANVNLIVGLPYSTDLWENSQESLTLRTSAGGTIMDTLVYEANKGLWAGALFEGEPIWGNFTSIDSRETSWARIRDGHDTDNNGADFFLMPSTPGTTNNAPLTGPFPYFDNFGAAGPEAPVASWAHSFVAMTSIDPTVVTTHNPNTIPASPGGGNAAVVWDPAGGGNTAFFLGEFTTSVSYEAYVYFDATNVWAQPAEWEHWSVGFGTTGTYSNTPDPGGILTSLFNPGDFDGNGNTGVSWTYMKTSVPGSENILYLVDHNDGGWGPGATSGATVLGSVAIQAGVNDGWQRLRLEVNINPSGGSYVIGSFGGTLGCADGDTFQGQTGDIDSAMLYVGYRQNDGVTMYIPPTLRPFTWDDVLVNVATSSVSYAGTAIPTNSGTPALSVNGPPTIGNAGFTLSGSGLIPSNLTTLFIGVPLGPPGLPIPGGQPGSELLLTPIVTVPLPTDASGNFSLGLGFSCTPASLGATIGWQLFDLDTSLSFGLPFGNSQRLDTTFGN